MFPWVTRKLKTGHSRRGTFMLSDATLPSFSVAEPLCRHLGPSAVTQQVASQLCGSEWRDLWTQRGRRAKYLCTCMHISFPLRWRGGGISLSPVITSNFSLHAHRPETSTYRSGNHSNNIDINIQLVSLIRKKPHTHGDSFSYQLL